MTAPDGIRVASFDVFDTLLVRGVAAPAAVFVLLGVELRARDLVGCDPAAFAAARRAAELRAYRAAGAAGGEVRLAEIHAELGAALGLDDNAVAAAMGAELALEARLLRPVPAGAARVAGARAAGARVAFLSDTPLPGAFLAVQLERFGLLDPPADPRDLLLVSSDTGRNKHDGALYRLLLERTGAAPQDVLHVGNHPRHDVEAARAVGLRAEPALAGNPNRLELVLEGHGDRSLGAASLLAGAARRARLSVDATDEDQRALRDAVAGVAAPWLCSYVAWVLREAAGRGVRRLWFLSRDGQVLLDCARALVGPLGLEQQLELRYLLASRQAWNLPAYACGAHRDLAWVWDRTDGLSLGVVLARLGLAPAEVAAKLSAAGFDPDGADAPLATAELERLRALLTSGALRPAVEAASEARWQAARAHLTAEGVFDHTASAVVELVGHGNLQESLCAMARAAGGAEPGGFYLSWIEDGRARAMPAPRVFVPRVPGHAVVALEAFCAADHGTLQGYSAAPAGGGVSRAVFAPRNPPVEAWGLPLLRRTVAAFAAAWGEHLELAPADADPRAALLEVLDELWLHPTAAEARALGSFPWEDGHGAHTRYLPLAPAYRWRAFVPALRLGMLPRPHRAAWGAAAQLRTPRPRRAVLRGAARAGRAARWLVARLRGRRR